MVGQDLRLAPRHLVIYRNVTGKIMRQKPVVDDHSPEKPPLAGETVGQVRADRTGADQNRFSSVRGIAAGEPGREIGLEFKINLGGLGLDCGERRLVCDRRAQQLHVADFAKAQRFLRDTQRNGDVARRLSRYERAVVESVPLFAARRNNRHLNNHDKASIQPPSRGLSFGDPRVEAFLQVAEEIYPTLTQHRGQADKIVRRVSEAFHSLGSDPITEDGRRLHRGSGHARFRATNAQDRAIGRIMLGDEVLGRTGIKHRPRDEEAEGACHQDRIERLAGIVKFSAPRPVEPGQDAFDQFGRCPGESRLAPGAVVGMQIIAGDDLLRAPAPNRRRASASVAQNGVVTSGCASLSHKRILTLSVGRIGIERVVAAHLVSKSSDNKLPVTPAASFDKLSRPARA